jgi:hypothetical protein
MLNITNIPPPRVPIIDERSGLLSREWYRFFLSLFLLTGGGSNDITLDDLQISPLSQVQSEQTDISVLMAQYDSALSLIEASYLTPPICEQVFPDDLTPSVELGTIAAQNNSSVAITGGTIVAALTDSTTNLISSSATLSDGAAAAAGTITNAPVAGNPTKWVSINDNGTIRYIPAW